MKNILIQILNLAGKFQKDLPSVVCRPIINYYDLVLRISLVKHAPAFHQKRGVSLLHKEVRAV